LGLEFFVHENHEHSPLWAALEHTLRSSLEDAVAGELLPTSSLKTHIFVLSQDSHVQSAIFNAVWLCFLLHGVPLKRSLFHYEWTHGQQQGTVLYDLLDPTSILRGDYNSPPPEEGQTACRVFKEEVQRFLESE
jgi:hypothetical protein